MTAQTRHTSRLTVVAIAVFFFANGATYASWVPRLPEIRASLALSDTALGVTLVGGGIGGMLASLASSRLIESQGSRRATVVTSVAVSALLPAIAFAPSAVALFIVLVAIGTLDGSTDVAMNTQALSLQRHRTRSIVTRMHATWSVGTVIGGLAAAASAAAGVSLRLQLSITAVILLVAALLAGTRLLPPDATETSSAGTTGAGGVTRWLLGLLFGIGALAILAELPATEWAALMMAERFGWTAGGAGLGFLAFTTGMVVGRLGGDRIVDQFGSERTRRGGATLAAAGLVMTGTSPHPLVALIGLGLAGTGAATLFPVSIRRASELAPGSRGIAAFVTGSRLGILLGAPLMGVVSDMSSRSVALVVVGGGAAALAAMIRLPSTPIGPPVITGPSPTTVTPSS